MVTVIPAILSVDSSDFKMKLEKVWGIVSRVQLDVIDGVFCDNKTVDVSVLNSVDTQVEFDAHLMVDEPSKWVNRCKEAGVSRVFGQVEKMRDLVAFVADSQFAGMKVGLAYDIDTPLDGLNKVIKDLDAVLLMSVKVGQGGQKFDDKVLAKIAKVRRMDRDIKIVVDGGLNEENIKKCIEAEWEEEIVEDVFSRDVIGMEFVVGMHLFESFNVKEELERLQKLQNHGS
jgi:ribulose-phosphate 3-epimerase